MKEGKKAKEESKVKEEEGRKRKEERKVKEVRKEGGGRIMKERRKGGGREEGGNKPRLLAVFPPLRPTRRLSSPSPSFLVYPSLPVPCFRCNPFQRRLFSQPCVTKKKAYFSTKCSISKDILVQNVQSFGLFQCRIFSR